MLKEGNEGEGTQARRHAGSVAVATRVNSFVPRCLRASVPPAFDRPDKPSNRLAGASANPGDASDRLANHSDKLGGDFGKPDYFSGEPPPPSATLRQRFFLDRPFPAVIAPPVPPSPAPAGGAGDEKKIFPPPKSPAPCAEEPVGGGVLARAKGGSDKGRRPTRGTGNLARAPERQRSRANPTTCTSGCQSIHQASGQSCPPSPPTGRPHTAAPSDNPL